MTHTTKSRDDYRCMTNEALLEAVRYPLPNTDYVALATVLAERIEDGEHDWDGSYVCRRCGYDHG